MTKAATPLDTINLYIALNKDIPKDVLMRLCEYTASLENHFMTSPDEKTRLLFEYVERVRKLKIQRNELRKVLKEQRHENIRSDLL